MRKDDLKKHNAKCHNKQPTSYLGQVRSKSVADMFQQVSTPPSKRPRSEASGTLPDPEMPSTSSAAMESAAAEFAAAEALTAEVAALSSDDDDDHSSLADDKELEILLFKESNEKKSILQSIQESIDNLTVKMDSVLKKVTRQSNEDDEGKEEEDFGGQMTEGDKAGVNPSQCLNKFFRSPL